MNDLKKVFQRYIKIIISFRMKLKNIKHMNLFEKKILVCFILIQSLVFILIPIFWDYLHDDKMLIIVIIGIVAAINLIQLILLLHYLRVRREQKLYETFGMYHLHLEPILSVIQKKEMKLYQMTIDLKNRMTMEQEEMELYAQKIVNECFIQLNFTGDVLLNAVLFKYYNLFQSRKVELKTLVSNDFILDEKHRLELYEAVVFSFELMLWLLSYEKGVPSSIKIGRLDREGLIPSMSLAKVDFKRITFVLLQNRDGLQFNCCYESRFTNFLEIIRYLKKEKRKKYPWFRQKNKIQFEISPNSVSIKGKML